jgi:hypothetical protein
MIQWGARNGPALARKTFQSLRLAGEKILVPCGQLSLSDDRRTDLQPVHFTMAPAE